MTTEKQAREALDTKTPLPDQVRTMLAATLRQWREDLEMTRKTAATSLRCSEQTVESWESKKTPGKPKSKRIIRIEKLYKRKPGELITLIAAGLDGAPPPAATAKARRVPAVPATLVADTDTNTDPATPSAPAAPAARSDTREVHIIVMPGSQRFVIDLPTSEVLDLALRARRS